MFAAAFFKKILKDHEEYFKVREHVIMSTRFVQRSSKQAIFSMHKGDFKEGKKLIQRAESELKKLNTFLKKHSSFHHDGNVAAAREEFLEATYFCLYKEGKSIKRIPNVQAGFMDEWGALADFTGELVRDAVRAAGERDVDTVKQHREITQQVVGEMLKLHLSGKLRHKTDEAKRNLQRLEQLVYELSR